MTPARFRWGMILIFVGVMMIINNLGLINPNIRDFLMYFFPLFLIAVGIEKIFTNSKLQFISYLTTIGLFAGALAMMLLLNNHVDFDDGFFSESNYSISHKTGLEKLNVVVHLDETDITVRESGYDLLNSYFGKYSRKPRIKFNIEDHQANVSFTSRENSLFFGVIVIDNGRNQDWEMSFSEDVPLDLSCYGSYSDINLNLVSTPTANCKFDTDDATIYLRLGDLLPLTTVSIDGRDTKFKLRVPFNVGIKISGDNYDNYLSELGLKKSDGYYINENAEGAKSLIEVEIKSDLRSFALDFY